MPATTGIGTGKLCGGAAMTSTGEPGRLPRHQHRKRPAMRKTPTYFERDWNGDRSRVVDTVHPGCEWVAAGEGIATRKIDGTCCMVRNGELFKRRELRKGETAPPLFEIAGHDDETGKTVGWMPVEPSSPGDKYHFEAFGDGSSLPDGTYELVGPKVQGNPEMYEKHTLVAHASLGRLSG